VWSKYCIIFSGENNSWKAEFTPEINARAEKWIAENISQIPNFAFPTY
jgi:hypothetical protein